MVRRRKNSLIFAKLLQKRPSNATGDDDDATMIRNLSTAEASQLSLAELVESLQVDVENGLSTSEANRRHKFYGYNEFDLGDHESLLHKYFEQVSIIEFLHKTSVFFLLFQFKNPLILLLLGSAVVSVIMQQFDDAISITVAIVIVVTVAFIQVKHKPNCDFILLLSQFPTIILSEFQYQCDKET